MSQNVCQSLPASSTGDALCLQMTAVRATCSVEWTAYQIGEPCDQAAASAKLVPRPQQYCNIVEKLYASLRIHFAASEINYPLMFHCSHSNKQSLAIFQVTYWSPKT